MLGRSTWYVCEGTDGDGGENGGGRWVLVVWEEWEAERKCWDGKLEKKCENVGLLQRQWDVKVVVPPAIDKNAKAKS